MKTLLLNGCSFGQIWKPSGDFVKRLGCDNFTNISKVATSFQRTCRTTLEWISQNSDPTFVIIPITFSHRWELAVSDEEDELDGSWFPIQRKELIDDVQLKLHGDVSKIKLKQLVDLYYGSIPTVKTYWDKLFTEIILLASFLENRKTRYLFFDMCNEFDKKHIQGYKGFEKLKIIDGFFKENFKFKPKIAVTGMNPHCESILKNNEDRKIVMPAIKLAKQKKILVYGPLPADTIFLKQNRQKFDVILGMYHDQVLTPIKTLFEYDAINITMGLPFLRVSPDHGPNEKMINKNLSNPQSLIRALEFLDKS